MYGRDHSVVTLRKAKQTIGTCSLRLYHRQLEKHRGRRRNVTKKDGKSYLDIFQCFVEKGADVPHGLTRSVEFAPTNNGQPRIAFHLNVSERPSEEIYFLNDPGVRDSIDTLRTVEVPLDMSVPILQRGVKLEMTFGGVELTMKCIRCSDGREVEITVQEGIWDV